MDALALADLRVSRITWWTKLTKPVRGGDLAFVEGEGYESVTKRKDDGDGSCTELKMAGYH